MSRFTFSLYEINHLDGGDEEHLHQRQVDSAYEAINLCLDQRQRLDYMVVNFRQNGQQFGELSPYATWGTFKAFEEQMDTYILSTQIQLNMELDTERAAEDLIILALDKKRLKTR